MRANGGSLNMGTALGHRATTRRRAPASSRPRTRKGAQQLDRVTGTPRGVPETTYEQAAGVTDDEVQAALRRVHAVLFEAMWAPSAPAGSLEWRQGEPASAESSRGVPPAEIYVVPCPCGER